jgi:DNA-binding CsgD family transcriptional regulator
MVGGLASLGLGNHESVRNLCREGVDVARQIEDTHAVAFIMHVMGASAGEEGFPVRSARLWGAAQSILDTLGLGLGPAERHFYDPYFAVVRTRLGEEAFGMAWAEGREMSLAEALEYASSSEEETITPTVFAPEEPPSADQLSGKLTRREEEVTSLVARGLTNRRISEELFISERTVDAHVRKILKKLGLRSRAQIAARVGVIVDATEASTVPGMMASDE